MDDIEENTRDPENAPSNSSDQLKVVVHNSVGFTRNAEDEVGDVEIVEDDDDGVDEQTGVQRLYENDENDKKRKLESLLPDSYEVVPRFPEASSSGTFGERSSTDDWSENETLILLGVWGDKYLENGRKSLRYDEWQEIAEKVFQGSQIERTGSQCRNRLDTLKKKYRKEKAKMNGGCFASKWVYFHMMDSLIDMNPSDYGQNRVNGFDEERDSPGNLNSEGDSEGPSRNKAKNRKGSYSLFADCIEKFSKIYEQTENSKRQRMQELEKIRMDFLRDLESQQMQIFQKGHAEIARIRRGDDDNEEDDAPPVNIDS